MKTAQFFAAVALCAAPASAQPPPLGWTGAFATPSILCDTRAQLQSIVDAFGEGAEAGAARFDELFSLPNHRHEPTCAITSVLGVALETTELGLLSFGDSELYGWMIHVRNDAGSGFYLYLESPAAALQNTI